MLGLAVDLDSGAIEYFKNGSSVYSTTTPWLVGSTWFPTFANETGATTKAFTVNFGQGGQSGLTYDSASGGYFKYIPPSGFKALSTANLPVPTIAIPKNYFDALTYTGNGSTQSITGLNFQPDFAWIKARSVAYYQRLIDSVRGSTKVFYLPTTDAETTIPNVNDGSFSFDANGFSLGNGVGMNESAQTYVSWLWKESPTSGMDIVTFSGTGSGSQNVAHSLGVAPSLMILKFRNTTSNFSIYHSALGNTKRLTFTTAAAETSSTYWNDTSPTATQFTVGSDLNQAFNYVVYLFADVAGFSKFGSYTGNGSATDGPFVYTGFKPRFVMVKRSTSVGNWYVLDTARNTYNPVENTLKPNTNAAEVAETIDEIDALANGFKIRGNDGALNANTDTYIYAAFADVPFYYSAQPAASVASASNAAVTFLMGMTF